MSQKLSTVIVELHSAGMISVDDDNLDYVGELLNNTMGLNPHHDLVITSHEAREIRGLLDYLTSHEDEYIRKSSKFCIALLEVK